MLSTDCNVKCPYCQAEQEVYLDTEEGAQDYPECDCGKTFVARVEHIEVTVETHKAPCLNGEGNHERKWSKRWVEEGSLIEETGCFDCGASFPAQVILVDVNQMQSP